MTFIRRVCLEDSRFTTFPSKHFFVILKDDDIFPTIYYAFDVT